MNYLDRFIGNIESYYCPYDKRALVFIKQYLSKYDEQELKELTAAVMINYSNTYKSPPDINQFEKAISKKFEQSGLKRVDGHYEDIHRNVFDKNMEKIGHFDGSRFLPFLMNPGIKQKVLGYGENVTPEKYIEFKQETSTDIVKI